MILKIFLPKKQSIITIALLAVLCVFIVIQISMLIESYFNIKEINYLVDEANKRNLDYQLVVHNQQTHSYSFQILDE